MEDSNGGDVWSEMPLRFQVADVEETRRLVEAAGVGSSILDAGAAGFMCRDPAGHLLVVEAE